MPKSPTFAIMDLRGLATSILLLLTGLLYGQEAMVDQLRDSLSRTTVDTTRINLMNEIAWELKVEDPETARHTLQDAICLARSLGFKKGEATAFNYFGVLENIHGRTEDAVRYFRYALQQRSELGDQKGVASLYNNLGNLFVRQGDNFRALEQFQQSLQVVELLADTQRIARANYQIAVAHSELGNYPEALNHLFEFLAYAEAQSDSSEMALAYNLIGGVKVEIELNEEALTYFHRAREIRERLDDPGALAASCSNIGLSQGTLGQRAVKAGDSAEGLLRHEEAGTWYQRALGLYRSVGDSAGVAGILLNQAVNEKEIGSIHFDAGRRDQAEARWQQALRLLAQCRDILAALGEQRLLVEVLNTTGDVYRRQGRLEEALAITRQYMALAEQTGQSKFIRNGWKDLSRVYAQLGRWQDAYKARKTYDELRWEDFEQRRMQDIERREVAYGDMKKQIRLLKQEQALAVQEAQLSAARTRQRALLGGGIGLCLLALLIYNRYLIKARANRNLAEKNAIIEEERRKSDHLLLNILPAATAEELKQHGRATARRYESVSVLFTDFVGFTEVSATLSAEALVAELDTCFRAFDAIIDRYGLEKIKTIGDAYLCVGGLPQALEDHAAATVRAAMDMQAWMEERHRQRHQQGLPAFRMRVGIHTGPVVAGVVGDRKFAYDIWGDTVNTAARMESASLPGRINISEATRSRLSDAIPCSTRGAIAVKGKGELDMFWVDPPTGTPA
jgi:adenylate cyclase